MSELHALGKQTKYQTDYAPEVLESFENKHMDNDYFVKFNCPEFTSLCPITGQRILRRSTYLMSRIEKWLRANP